MKMSCAMIQEHLGGVGRERQNIGRPNVMAGITEACRFREYSSWNWQYGMLGPIP